MLAEDAGFANRPYEALEILSRLDPDWPWVREWQEYWSLLAYELHATGDFARELKVARQARATRPQSRRFLWLECQALAGLGRVDEVRTLVGAVDTLPLGDESATPMAFGRMGSSETSDSSCERTGTSRPVGRCSSALTAGMPHERVSNRQRSPACTSTC